VAEIHPLAGSYIGINKPTRRFCLGQTLHGITEGLRHFDDSSPDQFKQVQQAAL
jgi:hypothetical protein